jgi:hypothetical protein
MGDTLVQLGMTKMGCDGFWQWQWDVMDFGITINRIQFQTCQSTPPTCVGGSLTPRQ